MPKEIIIAITINGVWNRNCEYMKLVKFHRIRLAWKITKAVRIELVIFPINPNLLFKLTILSLGLQFSSL